MALFKDRRADYIADEATKARADGRATFAARLTLPTTQHDRSAHLTDWSDMVDAIETAGWHLEHWDVAGKGNDAEAYPVFRRA